MPNECLFGIGIQLVLIPGSQFQGFSVKNGVRPFAEPISKIDVDAGTEVPPARNVVVTHNDEVVSFAYFLLSESRHIVSLKFALGSVLAAFVRRPAGNARRNVGMDKREEEDVGSVPQDLFQDPIASVAFQEAVAMVEVEPFSLNHALNRIPLYFHAELIVKVFLQPEVMIPCQVGESDAGVREVGKLGEETEIPFWNNVCVLEPEIEQVSDDEQFLAISLYEVEELHEGMLFLSIFFSRSKTEMRIREEVGLLHILTVRCSIIP